MRNTPLFILILMFFFTEFNVSGEVRTHIMESSVSVLLADNGQANYDVITSSNASASVKSIANRLTGFLSQICGAEFSVRNGDGLSGIAVGVPSDFPNIPINLEFNVSHPGERQGYEIKSHSNGVYIIGATPLAVEYAVFDFLYHLGYRQYFPMKKWEIIPSVNKLEFSLHIKESPDYYNRTIWAGHGVWPEYTSTSNHWNTVNRDGGYNLRTEHAYDAIVRANQTTFNAHPEYYALVGGTRRVVAQEAKFCISNAGLRDLVVRYALSQFQQNPSLSSVSMDPSDGGGWCECEHCLAIGTPSTRAVFLANTVAEAVREKFPGKKIGMYAYNMHSPPPEIDVDQDVVVSVATSFLTGGFSLDEVIDGWKAKKAVLGIREYYDVYIWSKMLPGQSSSSNLSYLKRTIPSFYTRGARYLTSEASDDWVPSGLGYYIAERLLWNFDTDVSAIIDDFVNKAFGPASQTIKEFYTYLDGSEPKYLASDPIGRMYRLLSQARQEAQNDNEILERIDDLVLYTRYVELFKDFETAQDATSRQNNFNNLMDFISTIKDYRIIHTYAIQRGTHWRSLSPNRSTYSTPIWNSVAYSSSQIERIISNGIANNELFDFEPIAFSKDLIPVSFINDKPIYPSLEPRRDTRRYYTWVDEDLTPIKIIVTGGLIAHYRDRGNVRVSLYKLGGASADGSYETLIETDASTVPNGGENMVTLTPNQIGLHAVEISDGNDMTSDVWINYDKTFSGDINVDGTFYFYVPKETKKIGMYHNLARGTLRDADDNLIFEFRNTNAFQSFPVSAGQDGKIWSFRSARGIINLMTVPPYFSLSPINMLLPREVVEKDALGETVNNEPKLNLDAFVTLWSTKTSSSINYPGIGTDYTIVVRSVATGRVVNIISKASSVADNPYTITGLTPGSYTVEVVGNKPNGFEGFKTLRESADRLNLLEIKQWGKTEWAYNGLVGAFNRCDNLELTAFDQPNLTKPNTQLSSMFQDCVKLKGNSSITNWDTKNVEHMNQMFMRAKEFNQPLNWDVSNAVDMATMFGEASAFNQNLGDWVLNSNVDLRHMFDLSGVDCVNYGLTLVGWANNEKIPLNRSLGAEGLKYPTSVIPYRNKLISKGWTITDAGEDSSCQLSLQIQDTINTQTEQEFSVKQNPVNESAHFVFSPVENSSKIIIYDLSGKIVKEKTINEGESEIIISTSFLGNGVYFVKLLNNDKKNPVIKLMKCRY